MVGDECPEAAQVFWGELEGQELHGQLELENETKEYKDTVVCV